ncbi:MAG: HD domain-containing protein [Desulfonauticus sp.]|nr:HD domain-containing protein [Desulfonauticus sp.]
MKQKKIYVQDLKNLDQVEELFVVISAQKAQAQNGPFWNLILQDKTGQIPARIWSPASHNYPHIKNGQFVHIKGQVHEFKQQLQINIETLTFVPEKEIVLIEFLPSSKTPPEQLLKELRHLLDAELKFSLWRKIFKKVFFDKEIEQRLLTAPGGKKIHHAYIGGLLEHTLGVCKLCLRFSEIYPFIDREILLLAAALHDLGKAYEISTSIDRSYTNAGQLVGHIFLGLEKLQPLLKKYEQDEPDLILHLKHIILTHHGELEFGSPKKPQTLEALLLHFADNIDAKINIMQSLSKTNLDDNDSCWSEYNHALGTSVYTPPKTPCEKKTLTSNKKRVNQCLLPLKG